MNPIAPAQYAKLMSRNAAEVKDRVQDALVRTAERGAKLARQRTRETKHVDTGRFAEGWKAEGRDDVGGAAVYNDAQHAPYVDDGRRAGDAPPPIAALVRWVERRMGLGGDRAWAAARAISRRIAARGIVGAQIAKWLGDKLKPMAQTEVEKELRELVQR